MKIESISKKLLKLQGKHGIVYPRDNYFSLFTAEAVSQRPKGGKNSHEQV